MHAPTLLIVRGNDAIVIRAANYEMANAMSKSEMLGSKSQMLMSKSKMLGSKSQMLMSKSKMLNSNRKC